MPSASLLHWQNERMLRPQEIDLQCAASVAAVPRNARLIDENLRGYALLLSAHFQGFCRDLHTVAAQVIASKVRTRLQPLIQKQFTAHRRLDHGNPTLQHLKEDFDRFGFRLDLTVDPANVPRLAHLAELNTWRNIAAHQHPIPPVGNPLNLPSLRAWRAACDGLAVSVDGIMYNHLIHKPGDGVRFVPVETEGWQELTAVQNRTVSAGLCIRRSLRRSPW